MPSRIPILGGSLASLLAACGLTQRARADEPAYTTTWSQEALAQLEQPEEDHESPELKTLRLAEEELFARTGQDGAQPKVRGSAAGMAEAPTTPPARLERPEGSVDLAFLKNLKLPGLPVRWDRRVLEYLVFFKDDPRGRELAAAWLKRRERYGPMMRRALAEHALPPDVQYLAMIESGYDPLAHSNADAWGLWQFVKEPAVSYGLRVDHWVDERLDPERASHAAARYLRDLYERFGSWDLAFAAYNMGYGGLLRSLKKYNTNDYWLLSHLEAGLPFETSLYVAKITAMAIVGHNPERFGFGGLAHEPTLALAKADVPAGTPLVQVANVAGISIERLRELNPHLRQSRVPPGEPSAHLYLPREGQVRFAQRWARERPEGLPVSYVVRLGETLEDVAKRAGMSPAKLRELNELSGDVLVKGGFPLLVPAGARMTSDLVEPLVASVPAKRFRYPSLRHVFYRVGAQDTVQSVARFFDVSLDELSSWNNVSADAALQPGMLLQLFVKPELDLAQAVVYEPKEVRILTVGSDEFFDYHEAQRGRVRVRYRVRPSDTLDSLAKRFALSAGSIGRINQFASNRPLKANEWVTLYVPAEQLAELERKGGVERVGSSPSALAHKPEPGVARAGKSKGAVVADEDELPEAEGAPLLEPKKEAPIAPPQRGRGEVAAPSRPIVKAPKQRKL